MADGYELFTPGERAPVRYREATLTARVTDLITKLIVDQGLQPGDRLPSVRDLAERFGVSRTVVREAVGALVAKSLLEVRHGSGTTVRSPSTQSVSQSMILLLQARQATLDYAKVHELRRVLEIEIAGLAAERHTERDLELLEQNLAEMARIIEAGLELQLQRDRYAITDVNFHAALAQATHNELFVVVLDSIADVMHSVRQISFLVPDAPLHAVRYHRMIFEYVRAGDVQGARQAMFEHLADSQLIQQQATQPIRG
jgi:GntR family transcriptional regulator, transcriptional repressor for pyruvate dehydrogenase complex